MIPTPVGREDSLWWRMGSMGDQPVMQIAGELQVANISSYSLFVTGAKLRKPKAVGNALVHDDDSNTYSPESPIPQDGVSEVHFDFYIYPPACEKGQPFKADVAIIDQFGNEHWSNELEFFYS